MLSLCLTSVSQARYSSASLSEHTLVNYGGDRENVQELHSSQSEATPTAARPEVFTLANSSAQIASETQCFPKGTGDGQGGSLLEKVWADVLVDARSI